MLFEPFSFSGIQLKNRIVRSATYEKRADEHGFVTESLVELYVTLARGGSGLIITGGALVHPSGRSVPRMLCAHSNTHVGGLKTLAEGVHDAGGVIALQLVHGGRQCPPILLGGEEPLAPSAVYDPSTGAAPRAMTDPEIWRMVDAFGEAAWRARSAGFDALELHAAHGFLISSFLSPHTNRRDDYWGGDEVRRFHFIEEVYKSVRNAVGADFPVLAKINCDDLLPGGITPPESTRVALRLQEMGLNAVEISGGMKESKMTHKEPAPQRVEEEPYFVEAGGLFSSALSIPVILTGGFCSRAIMEDALKRGCADLIGLSRPLIREPDLPLLMQAGKERADCISCSRCKRWSKLPYVRCRQIRHASSQPAA
jgi:2,4-dienoyl-CoA reductase-like NADH-dependent reductase (Old Yellow Enzyme family)